MPAENFHVKRDHYDHSKAADRSAQKKMEGRVHEAFLKKCKETWTKGGSVGVMITVNKFSQVPQITKTYGLLVNPAVQNAIGEAMRQKLMESEVNTILASQVVADENSQQPPPQQVVGAGNDDGNVPPIIANVADGPIGSSSQQQPQPQQVVVADESAQQSPSQQDIVADESPQQPPPQQVVEKQFLQFDSGDTDRFVNSSACGISRKFSSLRKIKLQNDMKCLLFSTHLFLKTDVILLSNSL